MATTILDNEAVQALVDPRHRKHRRMLALCEAAHHRGAHRRSIDAVLVPVAVRVEAGWTRNGPEAARINLVSRARDVVLDTNRTNRATLIRRSLGVSVTDATIGELIGSCAGPIQVITSDRDDSDRMAAYLGRSVEIIVL